MALADHKKFLAWSLLACVAWSPALYTLVRAAFADDNYSYTLLVLGVSIVLLCLESWETKTWETESRETQNWDVPSRHAWPIPALCLAAIALAAAFWLNLRTHFFAGDWRLSVGIVLWIAFIIAAFLQTYGSKVFARLSFPFLFSLLSVPLPTSVMDRLILALQWGSADSADLLFRLFHVPVVRDGLIFSFSKIEIEVAQECSSIRSSTILVVTTLVIAQLFLKSKWSKWISFLISLPVAVLKNGVRIFTLSVLAEYVSTNWLDSWLHHHGGFVFLALALALMFGLIAVLWRVEQRFPGPVC
jgi:exosortase